MAVGVEPEGGRDPEGRATGQVPCEHRRQVVRGVPQSEAMGVAKAAVQLDAGGEVLGAQGAGVRQRRQRQRAAGAERVAELPDRTRQVFLGDEVGGKVPIRGMAGEDQLGLHLAEALAAGLPVGRRMVGFAVVPDHLEHRLVGAVDVLEFDVEHRVDPVLAQQRPPAVLPAPAGERRAVAMGRLAVEVELGRPPTLDAVLQLRRRRDESARAPLAGDDRIDGDLQVAELLQLVVVGDEERALLGARGAGGQPDAEQRGAQQPKPQAMEPSWLSRTY